MSAPFCVATEAVRHDGEAKDRYHYAYDASGNIAKVEDYGLGRTQLTETDLSSRPVRYRERAGNRNLYRQSVEYDASSRVVKQKEAVGEDYAKYETSFVYDIEDRITEAALGGVKTIPTYDKLGRVEKRTLRRGENAYETRYAYEAGGYGENSTTGQVTEIVQPGHVR